MISPNTIVKAFALFLLATLCEALPVMHPNASGDGNGASQYTGCEGMYAMLAQMHAFTQVQVHHSIHHAIIWLMAGCIIGVLLTYSLFQEQIEREPETANASHSHVYPPEKSAPL
ncbi:hypothetical protein LPJ59_005282 [Coemansia sp. RSA 2399]|nr:hypothetical protein LPJ59_005282 [Coemansia sp. RSA 2399]KAJ1894712.1 hypothetical protein LPJ81_005105 [Coemansia sp. IMI 209127]